MSYQKANRLATVDNEVVEFDADGNMLAGGVNQFDSRNRLVKSGDVVYSYDAENQRIGVNQTQYIINSQPSLSQVLVQEIDGQKTFYIYGLGLIGQEVNGEYISYHFDFRGSTVALTDSSGQIVEQYQYSPYGLLLSGDSSKTPFLFNGKYGVMTDSNNLYYMRARFYSPEIKRFINQDILLGNVFEGQTLNRYAFVTGRPVDSIDPFGLETTVIITTDPFWLWMLPILYDSHAAVMIDNNGNPVLYDPNGTYIPPGMIRRGRDYSEGKYVNLSDYINYHLKGGSRVILITFSTTPEQEQEIFERIESIPNVSGFKCATAVTYAINDIGPFKHLEDSIPFKIPFIGITPGFLLDGLLYRKRNE